MAASTASLVRAWDCGPEMSARARFLAPLLWAVKMSGLDLGGRARPGVVVVVVVEGRARREERAEVKAALEEGVGLVGLEVRGRGRP